MLSIPVDTIELTDEQQMIRRSIRNICEDFGDSYWRKKDENGKYPHEFVDQLVESDYMGSHVPEEYGGVELSTSEVAVMMEEIAASGAGFAGAQAIHGGLYNMPPIVKYGSEELKEELLPKVANGEASIQSLALTEPNAGSNSTAIETSAERDGDKYVIDGQKIWTSRVDVSDYIVLMARTTPLSEVDKRTRGISMFLVNVEDARAQDALEIQPIPKTASKCVHSFEVWLNDLRVPTSHLIGEEGNGFYQLLDGLNEERIVIAAECVGLGELAIDRGVQYADERVVFDRKIGSNQAIQHPLAEAYAHVQAAKHVTFNAAASVGETSSNQLGTQANMAKYLAAQSAFKAADAAVQTHGGFGVAREYDVERYFREARLARLVPITQELVLNYIGEKALNLPKSY